MARDEKHRILIVDDEASIAESLAKIFANSGYSSRAAYSAEAALEMMPEWRPELAILDVYLPAMNGIDLAIHIRAEYSDCRILLFSGQPAASELLSKAGATFELWDKPIHPSEFLGKASLLFDEPAN